MTEVSTASKNLENKPIWESENAQLYSSSPGLNRYVIWKYNPVNEGVRKYPRFNSFDPLPYHYYTSDDEFQEARKMYIKGESPDKFVDVVLFPSWENSLVNYQKPELTVYESSVKESDMIDQAA